MLSENEFFKFGVIGGFQTIPAPQISEWGRGPMGLTKTVTGVSFPWSIIIFLKVLGIHKGLFSKVPYAGVRGRAPRSSLPDKLQFEVSVQTTLASP